MTLIAQPADTFSDRSLATLATPALALELNEARARIRNLEIALRSSRTIGTAIGILVERHKLTPEQAFDVLVAASQQHHLKLRDVADTLVFTGDTPTI